MKRARGGGRRRGGGSGGDAVRAEFKEISGEVFRFGKSGGKSTRPTIRDCLPLGFLGKKVFKKRTVPFTQHKRSVEKKREKAEKIKAAAVPADELPVYKKPTKPKGRNRQTTKLSERTRLDDRRGLGRVGNGTRGIRTTTIGRYKNGLLTIANHEAPGARQQRSNSLAQPPTKRKKVGWIRKGQRNKRKT
jgi:hypothetical protein